jgi:hypothetical protein
MSNLAIEHQTLNLELNLKIFNPNCRLTNKLANFFLSALKNAYQPVSGLI